MPETKEIAPAAGGIRFTVASRPQRRYSNVQTVSNLAGATSFAPISLPATGFVRKIALYFSFTGACASAGAVVAGDAPWNLISGISLTDATGQPITQPVSGYVQYLRNKYFASGTSKGVAPNPWQNPQMGPEYAFAATSTTFTATFRLDIDLEIDPRTGYGCIPNLDSNASLQLKIDVAPYTNAFTGTTVSAASLTVRVDQHYWAPVGASTGGVPNRTTPPGFGDYVETRYESQPATASTENTLQINNRGGLIRGFMVVARAAGVRTAWTAGTNVGLVYDNNAIDEGIRLEAYQDQVRRAYGFQGADLTTSYAPLTAGVVPGLDRGVLVFPFDAYSADGRDTWLSTRVGTLLQVKATPGASVDQVEIVTLLAQVRDAEAFYA